MNTEAAGGEMTTHEGMAAQRYRWSEEDCALYDGDEIVICCLAQDDLGPVIAAALNSRERLVAALCLHKWEDVGEWEAPDYHGGDLLMCSREHCQAIKLDGWNFDGTAVVYEPAALKSAASLGGGGE